MKKHKKIVLVSVIVIFTALFIMIYSEFFDKQEIPVQPAGDDVVVFKNGEVISDIKIHAKHGKTFDIDDFKNEAVLFVFLINNNKELIKYYKELNPLIKDNVKKGLQLVFVAMQDSSRSRPDTLENNMNTHIFYETNKADFIKKFKRRNCCDAMIMINKNHEVVLNATLYLSPENLSQIVNKKSKKIFSGKDDDRK